MNQDDRSPATKADIERIFVRLEDLQTSMDLRFANVDGQFAKIDKRFKNMETRFNRLEAKFDRNGEHVDYAIAILENMDGKVHDHEKRITNLEKAVA